MVISEDGECDNHRSISDDNNLISADISTPLLPESAPGDLELSPQLMDANWEWPMREIKGDEIIDGEKHYEVEWHSSLIPESAMGNALELVAEYEARKARIRAGRGVKKGKKGQPDLKQSR